MPNVVNPIPRNFHTITPNLVFQNAAGAIDFYKKVFGAIETVRMPGPNNKIMHCELKIGNSMVFVVDTMTDKAPAASTPTNFIPLYLHLYVEDVDATFKRAVEAGAKVDMPLEDMFWGDRYGKFTDPFGQQWSVASHTEDVSPDEMQRRMQALFSKSAAQS
jgi:PhnB protein